MVTQLSKPAIVKGSGTRVKDINSDPNFTLDARNAQITAVSEALAAAQLENTVGEDAGEYFISIEDGKVCLVNEFFYNASIKDKEWKIRVVADQKYKGHYKATNTSGIIKAVEKALLAE